MKDPARAGQTGQRAGGRARRRAAPHAPDDPVHHRDDLVEAERRAPGDRDLPGRLIAAGGSPRLVKAQWPTVGDFSQAAEHIFPRLQEIVGAIRTVRNEHKVDPKQER